MSQTQEEAQLTNRRLVEELTESKEIHQRSLQAQKEQLALYEKEIAQQVQENQRLRDQLVTYENKSYEDTETEVEQQFGYQEQSTFRI
ncbi:hypothetical protein KQI58_17440 [Enterococcus raffinosus]|uniref:hypothetical protein n=1 Tax=Enterococcus raffinosus TaxID=71452 RepID=UPI001C0F58A5|nr:hypothetical protein [Enterococcus raffinosus]MBU5362839.1 hypothetical protein [Enterococcus raffinosus]